MPDPAESKSSLLTRAVAGEPEPLAELLWRQFDPLAERIGRKLPIGMQGIVSIEDIMQQTFVEVWKNITSFPGRDEGELLRWMTTIANNKLIDCIRAEQAIKRGAGRAVATGGAGDQSSVVDLIGLLEGPRSTPSGIVSRKEAEQATILAMKHLKPDYHLVVSLRFFEGLSVAEIADQMNRSEGSIHMLLNRAIKKLCAAMGNSSLFFSKS
jgi:RNA polymerase sigma-70 factor (ECF subfamily)